MRWLLREGLGAPHPAGAKETAAESAKGAAAAGPATSIEQIATAIGCTAEVNVEAEELRQGGCEAGQVIYRMVTFAAEQGLKSWLTEARMYGGIYLVGDRWVVTAQTEEALTTLRGRLGGDLQTGDTHGGTDGKTDGKTGGETHDGGSGH